MLTAHCPHIWPGQDNGDDDDGDGNDEDCQDGGEVVPSSHPFSPQAHAVKPTFGQESRDLFIFWIN